MIERTYEEYANNHGLTLGDKADFMMELRHDLEVLWVNSVLTDVEYKNALRRLDKIVIETASRLDDSDDAKCALFPCELCNGFSGINTDSCGFCGKYIDNHT